jgi:GT2 family glycosyltransferase/glycosyltransferase involved in cell wall biosynthesis
LSLCLAAADRAGRAFRPLSRWRDLRPWRAGISVVIPERDSPSLLLKALASLYQALEGIGEPHQVIVVVNGADLESYAHIAAMHPNVEWVHQRAPLGFSAAICKGLRRVERDWTFLMNNDVTIDASSLRELCALRSAEVFAIACQIHQRSATGRREETGLIDWYRHEGGVQVFHADPGDDDAPRPHLCASGGASLFRTAPLRAYALDSRCYDPFYWEDVEWGVRAWQDGLSVLFCPRAHAWHQHRATTSRFYAEAQIERIAERNRLLFDVRNAISDRDADELMIEVCDLPYESQRSLARLRIAGGVLRNRWHARRAPRLGTPPRLPQSHRFDPDLVPSFSYRLGAAATVGADAARASSPRSRPLVLFVTPFCVFPPRHGGARRIDGLLRELRRDFDVVLVTDEATIYDVRSFACFDRLHAVHFVQRPRDPSGGATRDLGQRLGDHCHPSLVEAVQAAIARYRPDIVQIEHVELADLSRLRLPSQRWVLGLHDAYAETDFFDRAEGALLNARIADRYDAVTVCSAEDRNMISHPRVVSVPNGSAPSPIAYEPSASLQMLFAGPFRYAQNLDGIRRFLSDAYPSIKSAIPAAAVLILGGEGGAARVAGDAAFSQDGVSVLGHREDVPALLAASALTLNPLTGIRGSAIKVIESLAAGRVCVSTEDGARGFADAGFAGLLTTARVADMARVVIELLRDDELRHRLEAPDAGRLAGFQWRRSAEIQGSLYRELLQLDGNGV